MIATTMEYVDIDREPVELCKLLKIANMVSGGGEAKMVIAMGEVLLNGETELQKRKKIYAGDVIEFNGELITARLNKAAAVNTPAKKTATSKPVKAAQAPGAKTAKTTEGKAPKRTGRKPISF